MRNLVFDIGNTLAKYAVFEDNKIILIDNIDVLDVKACEEIISGNSVDAVIFSAVGRLDCDVVEKAKSLISNVILADYTTALPCDNFYESKETLGFDRIAACIGAAFLYPNKNILVIDAGTAITYDIITANNEYLGGIISLGLNMRYRALEHFTDRLPLCEISENTPLIGKTTVESIVGGVQNGIIAEIDAYICNIKIEYPDVHVFLTGGDVFFFDKKLKNGIFVNQKLLFYGLNRILEYNAEK
ncbi:MAG: type III pantothenate kinase [Marinifilaceae bacterium]